MVKVESMEYCRTKALPSALFGGGIDDGDCSWATPVDNALYRVALGYEQSPGKGQKAAPNLAVEEQSRARLATALSLSYHYITKRICVHSAT